MHKALSNLPVLMKAPSSPTRFRASVRHYHRQKSESSEWDTWIGSGLKAKKKWLPKLFIVIAALLAIGLTFAAVYAMRPH